MVPQLFPVSGPRAGTRDGRGSALPHPDLREGLEPQCLRLLFAVSLSPAMAMPLSQLPYPALHI